MKWICDHRSESQFKQLRNSPKKKEEFFGASKGFEPVGHLRSRCSALTAELWSPIYWQAGQFIEVINPWKEWNTEWNYVNCGNTNEMNIWPWTVNRNLISCEIARKKGVFRGFNGIRTRALCVRAQLRVEHCSSHNFILWPYVVTILSTPETSRRLSTSTSVRRYRLSGIVWVIFASYNWVTVTLETMDQL